MDKPLEMQPIENGFVVGPRPEEPPRPDALSSESIMALVIDRLSVQVILDVLSDGSGFVLKTKVGDRLRPEFTLVHQSEPVRLRPMGVQPQFQKDPPGPF